MKIVEHTANRAILELLDQLSEQWDHEAVGQYRDMVASAVEPPTGPGRLDAERFAREQTAFLREVTPVGKAPFAGINADGDVAFWGTFKTSSGIRELLVLVLPDGFPEKAPEVYRVIDGDAAPVEAEIADRWTVNDHCGFALREAKRYLEDTIRTKGADDATSS